MRVIPLSAALLSVTVAATVLSSAGTAHAQPVVLDRGHVHAVEVAGYTTAGVLDVNVHDGSVYPPVQREPGDVVFHVTPDARRVVPDNPAFAFLGAPGDPVWILPQAQESDLLFLGWSTRTLGHGVFVGDTLTWRLLDVEGPADFSLFYTSVGSPVRLFDSGNGLPDTVSVSVPTDQHANWAFEAEGDYTLTVEVRGTLVNGRTVASGPIALSFTVGS